MINGVYERIGKGGEGMLVCLRRGVLSLMGSGDKCSGDECGGGAVVSRE